MNRPRSRLHIEASNRAFVEPMRLSSSSVLRREREVTSVRDTCRFVEKFAVKCVDADPERRANVDANEMDKAVSPK